MKEDPIHTKRLLIGLLLGLGLSMVVMLSLSGSQAAEAAPLATESAPSELEPQPQPLDQALPEGATSEWWAAVQAQIRQDAGPLSIQDSTADWTDTGENDYDGFGAPVASAGDVNGDGYADVIVSARDYSNYRGRVYVYHGSVTGLGTTPAFSATGENNYDGFGASVASAGDVNGDGHADIVISAVDYGGPDTTYVYHGSPTGLSATPVWIATGESDGDEFGISVASAGDVNGDGYADVIVGANSYGDYSQGRAYVYCGSASGLGFTPAFTITGEDNWESFGTSVAPAGDVNGDGYAEVIIGAKGYDADRGKAYVYYGSAGGLTETLPFTTTGEGAGHWFGHAVAGAGDVNGDGYADVAIGAIDYGLTSLEGKVYIYHGSATGLSATAAWTVAGGTDDCLGSSVAVGGDVNGDGYADLIVGARGNIESGDPAGKAYVYYGSADGLNDTPAFSTTGEYDGDWLGTSVAPAGDVNGDGFADVILGAPGYDDDANEDAGKAYVYHGGGDGLGATPAFSVTGENASDRLGTSVASAGDVNGDGYTDVVIGVDGYDSNRGRVYIYHGSSRGLSTAPAFTITGENADDSFGASVAPAGDVNGDGFADVVVGAYGYDSERGRVYVYHGGSQGLSATPAFTATGEYVGDSFATSVVPAGDVNGDGFADVVVGAPTYAGWDCRGKIYIYHGSSTGLIATPAFTAAGENDADFYGSSVAPAGDVNGDGFADVIVGALGYDTNRGKVYVYHGGPGSPSGTSTFTATGKNVGDSFGASVAPAGDVNGDGFADIVVGAPNHPSMNHRGKVYVYHGGSGGLGATPAFSATGEYDGDRLGTSVASAGDVNGDGFADVILGAPGHDDGTNEDAGKAYVYHGGSGGLSATPAFTASGENGGDGFGDSAASARDVNGDGFTDIVVGAGSYDSNRGRVYVYHGGGGSGRLVLARQVRGDDSGTVVQPWGSSRALEGFEVWMISTDPAGRGRVKLQVQVCPAGVPFSDASCVEHTPAAWTDVTTASTGVTLTEVITGLTPGTLYRWRARVLYAPLHVTEPGVTPPSNPAHGPWHRFQAQAVEADLRTVPLRIYLPLVLRGTP